MDAKREPAGRRLDSWLMRYFRQMERPSMTNPQLLEVLLKAIGFWCLAGGIAGLPEAMYYWRNFSDEGDLMMVVASTVAMPILLITAGWLFVRQTSRMVQLAWTENVPGEDGTDCAPARELLGVLLKAGGYWQIVNVLVRLPYAIARFRMAAEAYNDLAYSGVVIVMGLFLIFGTDWLLRFAYPNSRDAPGG